MSSKNDNSICYNCFCCGKQQKQNTISKKYICFDIYYEKEINLEMTKWNSKLFDDENCLKCFLACLCFYTLIFEHYSSSKYNMNDTCIIPCLLSTIFCDIITFPFCCGAKTNIFLSRQFLIKKYNLESKYFKDTCCICFCPCYVTYQHESEIKYYHNRDVINVR
jgi:hypothetical protein